MLSLRSTSCFVFHATVCFQIYSMSRTAREKTRWLSDLWPVFSSVHLGLENHGKNHHMRVHRRWYWSIKWWRKLFLLWYHDTMQENIACRYLRYPTVQIGNPRSDRHIRWSHDPPLLTINHMKIPGALFSHFDVSFGRPGETPQFAAYQYTTPLPLDVIASPRYNADPVRLVTDIRASALSSTQPCAVPVLDIHSLTGLELANKLC